MWSIIALLVIGIAFMMLTSVQDDIPANIRGLWDRPQAAQGVEYDSREPSNAPYSSITTFRNGWRVVKEGGNVELSKNLEGAWNAALRYDPPTFVATCFENRIYARVEARLSTTGDRTTELRVDGRLQQWLRAPGTALYAPDAKGLLQAFGRPRAIPFELTYAELGKRTFTLDSAGLQELSSELPTACRPH
jgi:hypothetical protein